jgi:hypothetical protein
LWNHEAAEDARERLPTSSKAGIGAVFYKRVIQSFNDITNGIHHMRGLVRAPVESRWKELEFGWHYG